MYEAYNPNRTRQVLDVEIRAATVRDIECLTQMSLSREPGDPTKISSGFRAYLDDQSNSILRIATVDNLVAGFGKARLLTYINQKELEYPGWYLIGLIVAPEYRGAGVGMMLTLDRIEKIREVASEVYYFANARNRVSIELHEKLGFRLEKDGFSFPGVTFTSGRGCLYKMVL
jgi:ribosomal protein S18 acetylase RimI-like enzyme